MNSYLLTHQTLGERQIGVLRLRDAELSGAPTVIILHGLGDSKEDRLGAAYRLAEAGFDVVALDLYLHGERPGAASRDAALDTQFIMTVRDIIFETAGDIPAICHELGIDYTRAGILGISAGGFVAHALAIQQVKFGALAAAISSPDWLRVAPEHTPPSNSPLTALVAAISPVNQPDKYSPLPVLLMNGDSDATVSAVGSVTLHERLVPLYKAQNITDRLELALYPGVGHYVTREMLAEAAGWFKRFL
jgi:alpha-beta hydrolase superfamily lysophospholipase